MSPIRPLEREDLPAVADLYELVIRSELPVRSSDKRAPRGLADYFAQLSLDQPQADPEIPSLVYDDADEGIVGFIASHARRLTFNGQELRMGCSGQLVAHPGARSRGVGALLMRAYLKGPQDITITDGATHEVRAIWERMGGVTNAVASVGWTRPLAPAGFVVGEIARRRGRDHAPAARALATLDQLAARPLRPRSQRPVTEPLTPAAVLAELPRLARAYAVLPAYDERYLQWLFSELEAVTPRGRLARQLVRTGDGRVAGWYVAFMPAGDVAQVMQIAGEPADLGVVIDALLHEASADGCTAVQGRVDPFLLPHLRERRCLLSGASWALMDTRNAELAAAITTGRALLTRLDGEWWMGHHVLDAAALAARAQIAS